MLARRLGAAAALAGALALAVFPSFVAVSRDNGVDPLLILLMLLACGAGAARHAKRALAHADRAAACSSGWPSTPRRSPPTWSCRGSRSATSCARPARCAGASLQLLVAGLVMLVVSFAWIAFVELTPASKRPYVGSSTNNTELGLTFEYNGFGRVEGQDGGPEQVVVRPGAYVPPRASAASQRRRAAPAAGSRQRRATHASASPSRRPRRRRSLQGPRTATRSRSASRPARCACSARASATRPAGCCRSPSSG